MQSQTLKVTELKEKIGDVDFELTFPSKITFISNDSGAGKTYLFNELKAFFRARLSQKDAIKMAFICLSDLRTLHATVLETLKKFNGTLIVIDNADIILRDKEKKFINNDTKNQYLIFGRDSEGLDVHPMAVGDLEIKDKKGTFKFDKL